MSALHVWFVSTHRKTSAGHMQLGADAASCKLQKGRPSQISACQGNRMHLPRGAAQHLCRAPDIKNTTEKSRKLELREGILQWKKTPKKPCKSLKLYQLWAVALLLILQSSLQERRQILKKGSHYFRASNTFHGDIRSLAHNCRIVLVGHTPCLI